MSADTIRDFKEITNYTDATDLRYVSSFDRSKTSELMAGVCADKGYDADAVRYLAQDDLVGSLVDTRVLGNATYGELGYENRSDVASVLTGVALEAAERLPHKEPTYGGSIHENRRVIGNSYQYSGRSGRLHRDLRKNGASRQFETGHVQIGEGVHEELKSLPIAIVGAGAAGVLTARALIEMGFDNVDVIDKRGKAGGIWQQPNVHDGSKNNPFDLSYDNVVARSASSLADSQLPGSGQHIRDYIDAVAQGSRNRFGARQSQPVTVTQGLVRAIEPGDLDHTVHLEIDGKAEEREYPVVIYAPGLGKPLPVNDPKHMEGNASRKEAGVRWQQQLSDEKLAELQGKRLMFIGLGNSTAEMVVQLQDYERRTGRKVDYRILTHYPTEMLDNPDTPFGDMGQVFRDTSKPELTKLAGDLSHIQRMYYTARAQGKIMGGVRKWHVEGQRVVVDDRDGIQTSVPYDQLYTLIGYGQDEKTLSSVGITSIDSYTGAAALDYDGEVQADPGQTGRERLHPGYFAIGPIAKNTFNPNAVVIPGIQYQLNDMLATVMFRAGEHAVRNPERLKEQHAQRQAAEQSAREAKEAARRAASEIQVIDPTDLVHNALKRLRDQRTIKLDPDYYQDKYNRILSDNDSNNFREFPYNQL